MCVCVCVCIDRYTCVYIIQEREQKSLTDISPRLTRK